MYGGAPRKYKSAGRSHPHLNINKKKKKKKKAKNLVWVYKLKKQNIY